MPGWGTEIHNIPTYPVVDAARYLQIPTATLRTWLKGRSYPTQSGQQQFEPLIRRPDSDFAQLSFTNLVEAHVLRVIRTTHNVQFDKVRKALDYIEEQFGTRHPLARVEFQTDGVDLFLESVGRLVNASRSGQLAMADTLKHLLNRVEWDVSGMATRLFPFVQSLPGNNSDKPLTIDPNVSFGSPVLTGTGLPTRILAELYDAGDSIAEIAQEYGCTPAQIHAAIWFESQAKAV